MNRFRSVVWSYFQKVPNAENKVRCQLCGKVCTYISNTSNMLLHIRKVHDVDTDAAETKVITMPQTADATISPNSTPATDSPHHTRGSAVWTYFDKVSPKKAQCKLCNATLGQNTSMLLLHLRKKHPDADNYSPTRAIAEASVRSKMDRPRARSIVWSYFTKIPNQQAAQCKLCSTVLQHANNTSPLLGHLRMKHPDLEDVFPRKSASGFSGTPSSVPKGRHQKSIVWYCFDRIGNDNNTVRCKLCNTAIRRNNNTSNMLLHLQTKHPSTFADLKSQRENDEVITLNINGVDVEINDEDAISSMAERASKSTTRKRRASAPISQDIAINRHPASGPVKHRASRSLLKMITVGLYDPAIVEEPNFKEFIQSLSVRYEMPSKKAIKNDLIPALYEETKQKMKGEVALASHFSLTLESWTYQETRSFMTLSAHFIKDSWDLSSIVLDTFECTDDKSETNIATHFKGITDDWNITSKITALVVETCNEEVSSAILVSGWEEINCFGQTINKVISNALAAVPELAQIRKKSREAFEFFDQSTKAAETLLAVQQQHNLPIHNLKKENTRFWTSTFGMLDRMVEQFEAVNTVLCFLGRDSMCLCDDEVTALKEMMEVLKPFEAATQELCTDPHTCISKVIPIATLLQQVTSDGLATTPGPQSALKDALISQMQQHFANIETNYKLAVATLLDPRFKRHAFTNPSALEAAQQQLHTCLVEIVENSETTTQEPAPKKEPTSSSFWNIFDSRVSEAGDTKGATSDAENECRRYFKEANIPRDSNPLLWWGLNEVQFPNLKVLAQKYLCIPATATASNHLFSKKGDTFLERRNLLKQKNIFSVVFLNKNLPEL